MSYYRNTTSKADAYVDANSLRVTVYILQYYSYGFIHAYVDNNSLGITVLFIHTFYVHMDFLLQTLPIYCSECMIYEN